MIGAVLAASIAMLVPWFILGLPIFGDDALIEIMYPSFRGLAFFATIAVSGATWNAVYEMISGQEVKHL